MNDQLPKSQADVSTELRKDFDYFIAHQRELVKEYDGKVVVISGQKVVGIYDDVIKATTSASEKYGYGNFLVQQVRPGDDSTSQTFYSRVAVHG
ncbi:MULTISPECIES: DUF5678 domain-containing protein [unclassified Rhodanobacter]|uniref:DUF5678 domain-containing protein n=1 Tax=Rhodanobacter humi TaxID=1888173 RepID=A0ABV4AS16_9GAMM